jgi:hypothetical protein
MLTDPVTPALMLRAIFCFIQFFYWAAEGDASAHTWIATALSAGNCDLGIDDFLAASCAVQRCIQREINVGTRRRKSGSTEDLEGMTTYLKSVQYIERPR